MTGPQEAHLRQLRYFVAVADELHFTKAAQRLFVSQPVLSRQIRDLESQLGTDLFARTHRAVALTEAGRALLPRAREVLTLWEHAVVEVRAATAAATDVLRVGMSTALGRGLLSRVRRSFDRLHPGVRLVTRQFSWDDATAGLAEGNADVGFVWLPLPVPGLFDWIVVAEEPRLVLLPPGHRLADRDRVEVSELLDEPWLALPEQSGALRDFWLGLTERAGHPVRVAAEVSATDETFEALVNGVGLCFVAEGNAPSYTRDGVSAVPVNGLSSSQLILAWRRADRRAAVRDFVRLTDDAAHDTAHAHQVNAVSGGVGPAT
nr:LysR family transcriptional regulator [Kibdelosporangium sp. MJ126-NF4]CEL14516.1 LysR-family transcriptional regulator [Kibdelosporangium sp. MJ126-NF4]CTQ88881.1 LysR-family transcriptional regulator [Kibdelosporangium sp. MJ126-NF4]